MLGTVGAFLCVSLFLQEANPDSFTWGQRSSQTQKRASSNAQVLSKPLIISHFLISHGPKQATWPNRSRGYRNGLHLRVEGVAVMWPSAVRTGTVGILKPHLQSTAGCSIMVAWRDQLHVFLRLGPRLVVAPS